MRRPQPVGRLGAFLFVALARYARYDAGMNIVTVIFGLMVSMELKHLFCESILLTPHPRLYRSWRETFREARWRAAVQGLGTLEVLCIWGMLGAFGSTLPEYAWLAGVADFLIHLIWQTTRLHRKLAGRYEALSLSDRQALEMFAKGGEGSAIPLSDAGRSMARKRLAEDDKFWGILEFSQMCHRLTYYAIIVYMVTR